MLRELSFCSVFATQARLPSALCLLCKMQPNSLLGMSGRSQQALACGVPGASVATTVMPPAAF